MPHRLSHAIPAGARPVRAHTCHRSRMQKSPFSLHLNRVWKTESGGSDPAFSDVFWALVVQELLSCLVDWL